MASSGWPVRSATLARTSEAARARPGNPSSVAIWTASEAAAAAASVLWCQRCAWEWIISARARSLDGGSSGMSANASVVRSSGSKSTSVVEADSALASSSRARDSTGAVSGSISRWAETSLTARYASPASTSASAALATRPTSTAARGPSISSADW